MAVLTPLVKSFVVRSVEGLTYENVSVMLVAAAPPSKGVSAPVQAAADSKTRLVVVMGGLLALVSLLATVAGVALFKPAWLPRSLRRIPKEPRPTERASPELAVTAEGKP